MGLLMRSYGHAKGRPRGQPFHYPTEVALNHRTPHYAARTSLELKIQGAETDHGVRQ